MARKRAPGGGRKPRGEFSKLASPLSIRMPHDMRGTLSAAARASGKSVTQELLRRLNDSFRRDRDRKRDPASRALCFLLAELIELVKLNTAENPQPSEWRSNPFAFRSVRLAFAHVMDALEPKGKMRAPTDVWLSHAMISADTPEKMAANAAELVLYWLRRPPMSNPIPGQVFPSKVEQLDFGMHDANRELLEEPKS